MEEFKKTVSLVILVLALLYDVSPVDIVPDIPVIGWVDDFFITATAGLNVIQQYTKESASSISSLAKTLKWILIGVGVIAVLLIILIIRLFVD